MSHKSPNKFTVGDFQVELEEGAIHGPTGWHAPSAATLQVLVRLAKKPGTTLGRDALKAGLWNGSCDADKALTRAIACLRHCFGDDAHRPTYLFTVPKRGYRLIAPVRWQHVDSEGNVLIDGLPDPSPEGPSSPPLNFLSELRERKVVGACCVYAVAIWVVFQVVELVFPALGLPEWTVTCVIAIGICGFPVVAIMSWYFDVTAQGLVVDSRTRRRATRPHGHAIPKLRPRRRIDISKTSSTRKAGPHRNHNRRGDNPPHASRMVKVTDRSHATTRSNDGTSPGNVCSINRSQDDERPLARRAR